MGSTSAELDSRGRGGREGGELRREEGGHTFAFLVVKMESDAGFFQADIMIDMPEDVRSVDSAVAVSGELCLVWVVWEVRKGEEVSGDDIHFRKREESRLAESDATTFFS